MSTVYEIRIIIFITFMVGITFMVFITFMGDTDCLVFLPLRLVQFAALLWKQSCLPELPSTSSWCTILVFPMLLKVRGTWRLKFPLDFHGRTEVLYPLFVQLFDAYPQLIICTNKVSFIIAVDALRSSTSRNEPFLMP